LFNVGRHILAPNIEQISSTVLRTISCGTGCESEDGS